MLLLYANMQENNSKNEKTKKLGLYLKLIDYNDTNLINLLLIWKKLKWHNNDIDKKNLNSLNTYQTFIIIFDFYE